MIFNKCIPELDVTNLKRALDFYLLCGFKIEYERKEDKFAFLSLEGTQLMLQELSEENKWYVGNLEYPFGRGINFQVEVDDVESIYNKLKENNYKIAFPMEENWYRDGNLLLGCKEFLVQDPDGYLFRFQSDLGCKNVI
ncbi:MAG TPA: VOC family protein [Candidatus Coprovivens excrementavium]|nr:VOC family protein [Candidatus Coprovivens excrementavium]